MSIATTGIKTFNSDVFNLFKFLSVHRQTYYFHAKKREPTWTKPENVRIIKQSDLNAIAAAAGVAQQPTGSTAATAAGDAKATDSTAPDAGAGQKASNGEI